jgi:hypothetical protein
MRRTILIALAIVPFALIAANYNISMPQAITQGVLDELGFEIVPDTSGRIGGPSKFKITDATIKHLQKLQKEGKHVIAKPDGSIELK